MNEGEPRTTGMDPKTVAIICYLTFIGWIIALILNNQNRSEFVSFHLRQMLGLILLSLVGFIPVLGWIVSIIAFILWILAFIGAVNGEEKAVPIVGQYFQEWFRGL